MLNIIGAALWEIADSANALRNLDLINALSQSQGQEPPLGLQKLTMHTNRGDIIVRLPNDLRASDTISGTVVAEPKGKTDQQKQKNASELNGMVVDAGNAKLGSAGPFRWIIPIAAGKVVFRLLDARGKVIGTSQVDIRPLAANTPPRNLPVMPTDFALPTVAQAGKPMVILGNFDGDSQTTSVNVDGHPCPILAESFRQTIVDNVADKPGPMQVTLQENGVESSAVVHNLTLSLDSPKTTLLAREKATVTATVQGLADVPASAFPLTLNLTNQTPGTISMSGGQSLALPIKFEDARQSGGYRYQTEVTAITAGSYTISGAIQFDAVRQFSPVPARFYANIFTDWMEKLSKHVGPSFEDLVDELADLRARKRWDKSQGNKYQDMLRD